MVAAVVAGRIDAVITDALLDELLEVLARPRLARYEINDDVIGAILELAWPGLPGISIDVALRDADDSIVVEAAISGAADAIVTGDKDLLEDDGLIAWLVERGIAVITPADLLAVLEG